MAGGAKGTMATMATLDGLMQGDAGQLFGLAGMVG